MAHPPAKLHILRHTSKGNRIFLPTPSERSEIFVRALRNFRPSAQTFFSERSDVFFRALSPLRACAKKSRPPLLWKFRNTLNIRSFSDDSDYSDYSENSE